jgi:hypothetical protein
MNMLLQQDLEEVQIILERAYDMAYSTSTKLYHVDTLRAIICARMAVKDALDSMGVV